MPNGCRLRWLYHRGRALVATMTAHIHHMCPPSRLMRLDCHVGNVQACCTHVESEANLGFKQIMIFRCAFAMGTVVSNIFARTPTNTKNNRVASRFSISVRYWSVFSRYFTNRYRRKTRSGRFGILHLAGTPFFPKREASAPFLMDQAHLLREK